MSFVFMCVLKTLVNNDMSSTKALFHCGSMIMLSWFVIYMPPASPFKQSTRMLLTSNQLDGDVQLPCPVPCTGICLECLQQLFKSPNVVLNLNCIFSMLLLALLLFLH
jgi:hypothetical protein